MKNGRSEVCVEASLNGRAAFLKNASPNGFESSNLSASFWCVGVAAPGFGEACFRNGIPSMGQGSGDNDDENRLRRGRDCQSQTHGAGWGIRHTLITGSNSGVEYDPDKVGVVGSNPVCSTNRRVAQYGRAFG